MNGLNKIIPSFLFIVMMLVGGTVQAQLTGAWQDDNNAKYCFREIGNRLYWWMDDRPRVHNVFVGSIAGQYITGQWADLPGGQMVGNGFLSMRIDSSNRIVKVGQTGNYLGSVWTRINASECSRTGTTQTKGPGSESRRGTNYIAASPGKNIFLNKNEYLVSPNRAYFLIMQEDGNLVLYRGSGPDDNRGVVWHTKTYTGTVTDSYLAMQEDGNLVVYRGNPGEYHTHVWDSKTHRAPGSYFLSVEDDGIIVIYEGSGPNDKKRAIWSSPSN